MSRSGYVEDFDNDWDLIMYRGAVASAMRGRRGQKLLRELAAAMDAMSEKELIADDLVRDGSYCALGVAGAARGIDMTNLDPYDAEKVAQILDIAPALAKEIVYMNDEAAWNGETPEARWTRMREWVRQSIATVP